MSFAKKIKSAFSVAGQMLFPSDIVCSACGGELDGTTGRYLCADCPIEYNNQMFCRRCGRKIENLAELCDSCIRHGAYHFDLARSSVIFNETAQKLIHHFKYSEATYLKDTLAEFMADTVRKNAITADFMTFVPLHKKRLKKRGYNQAELLARSLSALTGIAVEDCLTKTVYTKNLAKLSREKRAEIIKDTFIFSGETDIVKEKAVLLIDDVFTTGATADECAKMLKKAGAQSVTVLTFASVPVKPA